MKKDKMQILMLIGLVAVVLIYAFVTYLVLPQLAQIETMKGEMAVKQAQEASLQSYAANPLALNKDIMNKEIELSLIAKVIPVGIDKPTLAYHIMEAVKKNQLLSDKITFDKPENKGLYEVLGVSFTVTGAYQDMINLINGLQASSDALALRSVAFQADEKVGLKADMRLQAYGRTGSKEGYAKPPFMASPFGIDSPTNLFKAPPAPEPPPDAGSSSGSGLFPTYPSGSGQNQSPLAPTTPGSNPTSPSGSTAPTTKPPTSAPAQPQTPPVEVPQTGSSPGAPAVSNPK